MNQYYGLLALFPIGHQYEITSKSDNILNTNLLGDSGVRGAVGVDNKARLLLFCWPLV
jgi:hypothetical protein